MHAIWGCKSLFSPASQDLHIRGDIFSFVNTVIWFLLGNINHLFIYVIPCKFNVQLYKFRTRPRSLLVILTEFEFFTCYYSDIQQSRIFTVCRERKEFIHPRRRFENSLLASLTSSNTGYRSFKRLPFSYMWIIVMWHMMLNSTWEEREMWLCNIEIWKESKKKPCLILVIT